MSHLRAPSARADRREGGRHGRPASRTVPGLPGARLRSRLLRLAVLPPAVVALGACAAVLFTVRTTGARPGPALWGVLAAAASVALAAMIVAAVAARRAARSVDESVAVLRQGVTRGERELRAVVEALRRGESPARRPRAGGTPDGAEGFDLLAADLSRAHDGAVTAVVRAAQLSSRTGSEQKLEVFLNLARRLQSLVHREISVLDELENEIEDPDLLKGLFHVDHLATRIRRHAENLAVLGGAVPRRQWSNPVDVTEVLRSAVAEVEQYSRVRLVPPVEGTLRGHAVADVVHLVAELVENATLFSAPHTEVLMRAELVTSGLAVEIEDRGLGMPVAEQSRMNTLLADPDQVNVARLLADGRIGLYVVSQLAGRHGITVRLQSNIYGGVQAVMVLPQALLGTAPELPAGEDRTRGAAAADPVPAQAPRPGPHAAPLPLAPATGTPAPAVPGPRTQPTVDGTGTSLAAPGAEPVPLPVRRASEDRPAPVAAAPGTPPGDRDTLAEHAETPPGTGQGAVRGTMDEPRLPRRRAREHLAPPLRGGPAPRQEPGPGRPAGPDPGLMAAFRRGIRLAEARRHEVQAASPPQAGQQPTGPGDPGLAPAAYPEPHRPPVLHPEGAAAHDGSARPDDRSWAPLPHHS